MKRILALLMVVGMLLGVSACGGNDAVDGTETTGGEIQSLDSALHFKEGSDEAYCPVCEKTVSWMALTQAYVDTIRVTDDNGDTIDSAIMSETVFESRHYYLAEDLTYHDSPVMGFFRGPGKGLTSCLHLNDHNITTPATTSIFGNSGVLNVMGDGVVTGYSPNDTEGAAVRCGNRNANNGLNLYGGTYKKTDNTSADSPVVAFDGAGRCVSVYDGVVIDGGEGVAVFANSSASREREGYLKLQGCTVYGDVKLAEWDTYLTKADISDCTISGTVTIPTGHVLALSGKLQINKLVLAENVKLTADELTPGTAIGLDAVGVFTAQTDQAQTYVSYFLPVDPARKVTVQDGALSCD